MRRLRHRQAGRQNRGLLACRRLVRGKPQSASRPRSCCGCEIATTPAKKAPASASACWWRGPQEARNSAFPPAPVSAAQPTQVRPPGAVSHKHRRLLPMVGTTNIPCNIIPRPEKTQTWATLPPRIPPPAASQPDSAHCRDAAAAPTSARDAQNEKPRPAKFRNYRSVRQPVGDQARRYRHKWQISS